MMSSVRRRESAKGDFATSVKTSVAVERWAQAWGKTIHRSGAGRPLPFAGLRSLHPTMAIGIVPTQTPKHRPARLSLIYVKRRNQFAVDCIFG